MSQFEGWRKVEDGAVDAAVTVYLSSTFFSLKFELGAYIFLCINGDMDQLVYHPAEKDICSERELECRSRYKVLRVIDLKSCFSVLRSACSLKLSTVDVVFTAYVLHDSIGMA